MISLVGGGHGQRLVGPTGCEAHPQVGSKSLVVNYLLGQPCQTIHSNRHWVYWVRGVLCIWLHAHHFAMPLPFLHLVCSRVCVLL